MRNKFKDTGEIPVTDLMLDTANYRIGEAADQSDCITMLFREFGDKMVHIAEHIARHGLSPNPIVVKKSKDGNWIVKDGNRRITALKLLNNPAMAPDKYKGAFIGLKDKFYPTGNIPQTISCITSDDDAVIFDFMQLEHLGPQEGAGQVEWGTREKDNMALAMGARPSAAIARTVCDYLQGHGLEEAKTVKITNIQRLLQDSYVQSELGIVWADEKITFTLNEADTRKALTEIVLDFASRDLKVSDIYDKTDRKNYIDKLLGERGFRPSAIPVAAPAAPNGTATTSPAPSGGAAPGTTPSPTPIASPPKPAPIPIAPPRARKHLIDRRKGGLPIPRSETKLLSIINELSRYVPVQDAPIAAGVLMRLVVEFSVNHYMTTNSIPDKGKLKKNIVAVAAHMESSGVIDHKHFEIISKMQNSDELFSANTLNHYVHSPTFMPTGSNLCTFWDEIHSFLCKCWL